MSATLYGKSACFCFRLAKKELMPDDKSFGLGSSWIVPFSLLVQVGNLRYCFWFQEGSWKRSFCSSMAGPFISLLLKGLQKHSYSHRRQPPHLFVFQEEMWEVGWKEFLNTMKCWSGTGCRLPCISDSLLVPLCRAHGKSAGWFAGKTWRFPSCKMSVN